MSAGILNITVEQGATFKSVITITDNATTPAPIDLTGYSARGKMRKFTSDPSATVDFTLAIRTQSGGDVGKIDWSLTASQTAALPVEPVQPSEDGTRPPTLYSYDVELVTPSSDVDRILQGTVRVIPEVTK